ncbi:hypothetical protein AB4254_08100 [Vibrio breoganii]
MTTLQVYNPKAILAVADELHFRGLQDWQSKVIRATIDLDYAREYATAMLALPNPPKCTTEYTIYEALWVALVISYVRAFDASLREYKEPERPTQSYYANVVVARLA